MTERGRGNDEGRGGNDGVRMTKGTRPKPQKTLQNAPKTPDFGGGGAQNATDAL